MITKIEAVKNSFGLSPIGSRFYDFVCSYFAFGEDVTIAQIKNQLVVWFSEDVHEDEENLYDYDTHTQFYNEYVHQKYRLALEFCANEVGFENVIQYDFDTGIPVSGGMFWLRGTHPGVIHWMMIVGTEVVVRGGFDPNSLLRGTLDEWLENTCISMAKIKATVDGKK